MSDLPQRADVVFVGAGHNALVAAAYLLQAGRSVCLLDQMPRPGGFVRTEELGAPGFHHDRWSAEHPMFVGGPAYTELGPDLARHGLEYVNAPVATGASLPNGKAAIVPVAQEEWAAELDRLGESGGWADLFKAVGRQLPTLFGLLGAGLDSVDAQSTLAGLLRDSEQGELPFSRLLAGNAVDLARAYFRTVIVSATPDQLYGRLLHQAPGVPAGVRTQAAHYRYRRGCFQTNLALSARPHFLDPRLDAGGCLNLGPGVDALVTSVRQADAGLLPEHPSISWHEPTAVDPSRAPAGQAVVRLQVLDAPLSPTGDAASTPFGSQGWDPATAEAFADRVLSEAELHVPGLSGLVLERHLTTPSDLAKSSPNAGLGDHGAGENSLVQGFTQRPIPAHRGGYRTAVPGVWLIGAATWPGAGVSGASGRAVAKALTGSM